MLRQVGSSLTVIPGEAASSPAYSQANLLSANWLLTAVESGKAVREKQLAKLQDLSRDELALLAQNPGYKGPVAPNPNRS